MAEFVNEGLIDLREALAGLLAQCHQPLAWVCEAGDPCVRCPCVRLDRGIVAIHAGHTDLEVGVFFVAEFFGDTQIILFHPFGDAPGKPSQIGRIAQRKVLGAQRVWELLGNGGGCLVRRILRWLRLVLRGLLFGGRIRRLVCGAKWPCKR